jgi:hypothetical protein
VLLLTSGQLSARNPLPIIASMTKSFTVMAIVKLRDEGKLTPEHIPRIQQLDFEKVD